MKLLIVTQIVDKNDPVLGFFHRWIEEFAKHAQLVTVICLKEGEHKLPDNVRVFSLGKERGLQSKTTYALRFLGLAWRLRKDYDSVFVHMNPEYVLLAGLLWKMDRAKTILWYVHKRVDLKLRLATRLVDVVCSVSPESFRLRTRKRVFLGHGIVLENQRINERAESNELRLITVGRISASKGLVEIIDALHEVEQQGLPWTCTVIGVPVTGADEQYLLQLRHKIRSLKLENRIAFLGAKRHDEIQDHLRNYDLFLHSSRGTGSVDKAVLESFAVGLPVVSTSSAFKDVLKPYGLFAHDHTGMAAIVSSWPGRQDRNLVSEELSAYVQRHHGLSALVSRIVDFFPERKRNFSIAFLRRVLLGVRDTYNAVFPAEEHAILVYHGLSGSRRDNTAVPADAFERHLALLSEAGYTFVSLSATIGWLEGQTVIPRKTVTITFDDGYRDFVTVALPILEKYNVPAGLFFVGDPAAYMKRMGEIAEILPIPEVRQLSNHPLIEVGFHSNTHPDLRTVAEDGLINECTPPIPTPFFAYPGGNYSEAVQQCLGSLGYTHAFSIKRTLLTKRSHRFALPRIVVTGDMQDWEVRAHATLVEGWLYHLRRTIAIWKK